MLSITVNNLLIMNSVLLLAFPIGDCDDNYRSGEDECDNVRWENGECGSEVMVFANSLWFSQHGINGGETYGAKLIAYQIESEDLWNQAKKWEKLKLMNRKV
ncbi:hypothetical protein L2E82_28052 [Cichorium intybus]|uniref:Uncharacterized protein n=1 Tax=Cichorium intybus TaxID=13427 RepID=A0ACB9CUQ3_CICIN|nr:hypothetical protein L2E82_28052 [Cichorium intybus]